MSGGITVLLLGLVLLAGIACGGADPEPIDPVEAYAEDCGKIRADAWERASDPAVVTIQDMQALNAETLSYIEQLTPPPVLAEYHQTWLSGWGEDLTTEQVMAVDELQNDIFHGLPQDIQAHIEDHGCWEPW